MLDTVVQASVDATPTLPYHCKHCGCAAAITLTTHWILRVSMPITFPTAEQQQRLRAEARDRAHAIAVRHAQDLARQLRCPRCGQRNRLAVAYYLARQLLQAAIIFGIALTMAYLSLTSTPLNPWILFGALILFAFGVYFVVAGRRDHRRVVASVRFTAVTPG